MSLSSYCGFLSGLLPALAVGQTSYNRWEARPSAPARPAKAVSATRKEPATLEVVTNPVFPDSGKTRYVHIEVIPSFPGGQQNYQSYVRKNLKRPKGPKEAGKVWVTFTALKSGAVANVHVPPGKGINPAYDAAAVELISKAPLFTPGQLEGKAADIEVHYPVEFR